MKKALIALLLVIGVVAGCNLVEPAGVQPFRTIPYFLSGAQLLQGQRIDLDDDFDTSIRTSADDTIKIEVGGTDLHTLGVNPAAGSGGDIFDSTMTLTAQDGSDTFLFWDINLTNANHAGTSNVVRVFDVAGVTGDAQSTESVLYIGSGWDADLNFVTSGEIAVDDTVVLTAKDPAAADAGATTDILELAFTSPVDTTGTNTHIGLDLALTIGNATGGTNEARAINFTNITGDAQVTESAIYIGSGYDVDLGGVTNLTIGVGGAVDFTITANRFDLDAGSGFGHSSATNEGVVFTLYNTVAYTDTSNKTMGVVPANANVIDAQLVVTTAFNSSGTDALDCGTTSGDPDEYVDNLDASAAGMNRAGDAADMPIAPGAGEIPTDVGGSDITVLCKFTQSVADATAGAATFVLHYIID